MATKNVFGFRLSQDAIRSSDVAVGRGRVDVIHAVLEEKLQRSLGVRVGDIAERRRTEDRAGALVAGPPNGAFAIRPRA